MIQLILTKLGQSRFYALYCRAPKFGLTNSTHLLGKKNSFRIRSIDFIHLFSTDLAQKKLLLWQQKSQKYLINGEKYFIKLLSILSHSRSLSLSLSLSLCLSLSLSLSLSLNLCLSLRLSPVILGKVNQVTL